MGPTGELNKNNNKKKHQSQELFHYWVCLEINETKFCRIIRTLTKLVAKVTNISLPTNIIPNFINGYINSEICHTARNL